jgi:hypothetical protein
VDARERRLAQNEVSFREVNERIDELARTHGADPHVYEFLCECSNLDCTFRIELSLSDYEAVRAHGNRFVILPDHFFPEVEHVIAKHDAHWVIQKHGEAGALVEELDPRRADAP